MHTCMDVDGAKMISMREREKVITRFIASIKIFRLALLDVDY